MKLIPETVMVTGELCLAIIHLPNRDFSASLALPALPPLSSSFSFLHDEARITEKLKTKMNANFNIGVFMIIKFNMFR